MDAGFSLCEADVMTPTAGDFAMTSDVGSVVCPDESKCLRIWLKIDETVGDPVYFGGTPEAASCT